MGPHSELRHGGQVICKMPDRVVEDDDSDAETIDTPPEPEKQSKDKDTQTDAEPKSDKKAVVPGNGNFEKATRNRVKGRDELPKDELDEFDSIKTSEIKEELKKRGHKIGSATSKVELWNRLKGRETEPEKAKKKKTKSTKEKGEKGDGKSTTPKKDKIPGNGNFAKASQKRAKGRDTIPADELEEFDKTKVTDLKARLQAADLSTSDRKIDLWLRWKDADGGTTTGDTEDDEGTDDDAEWDAQRETDEDRPWVEVLEDSIHDEVEKAKDAKKAQEDEEESEDDDDSSSEDDGREEFQKTKKPKRGRPPQRLNPGYYRAHKRRRGLPRNEYLKRMNALYGIWSDESEDGDAKSHALIKPTDYYINPRFLNMSVAQITKEIPKVMQDAPKPRDKKSSFRSYLEANYEYRRDIAQLIADGNASVRKLNEFPKKRGNMLPRDYTSDVLSFSDLVEMTPELLALWEHEVDGGNKGLWRNRWNHPRLSGFTCALLDGRSFMTAVEQYPRFALLVMDAIMDGRLESQEEEGLSDLQKIIDDWITELEKEVKAEGASV
jgi:hypothetical protein